MTTTDRQCSVSDCTEESVMLIEKKKLDFCKTHAAALGRGEVLTVGRRKFKQKGVGDVERV